ncbi:hypothetical protein [Kribbella jiaozuonensis]|uniref:Tat (Twin-arginine translocation) pathway signal sequence n=1 Tax=Kribbella jiaozuonensis TaxID=2575441 RepID=A0A4U3LUF5_9ACTN|nr:hypothetical protein [Kribbella jiaozuonensis]TKK79748.1 hypothetical protein FDA38_15295 [Kribbella jiaozuonensis]
MTSTTFLRPWQALTSAATATAALLVAFVLAPAALASTRATTALGSESNLIATFRTAFVSYWHTGNADFGAELRPVVDYWFRYHVAKALLAAALLAVLIALGVLSWQAFLRTSGLRAAALAASGVLSTALAVVSLAAVMANIHGMAAPFGSLLPMLFGKPNASAGPLPDTLAQIRQHLADGQNSPALDVIRSDYVKFHAVMAIEGTLVVLVLVLLSVLLWRGFTRTDRSERRPRRLLAAYGVFTPLLALTLAVIVFANATTAAHPLPGLESFFAGGW